MKIDNYYGIEVTEDVNAYLNSRVYNKGIRLIVWEDKNLNCYWVCNIGDIIPKECAKKIYKFVGEEIQKCYVSEK